MNDSQRAFAKRLAKAVTSAGTYTYNGTATGTNFFQFGGGPNPRDLRAVGRLSGLRAQRSPGNPQAQSRLIGQAVRQVNRGKLTFHKATSELAISTARRAPTVSAPAPGAALVGSGGSGYTGAPSAQLGTPQTAGTYVKPPGT